MSSVDMVQILKTLMAGGTLSEVQSEEVMQAILKDEVLPEQIGALLTSLHYRPPVATELAGFVKALRSHSPALPFEGHDDMLDVCGTGGDGIGTFNVSTTVAFIVAAAGVQVAKHGNRAVSSRCGSFDVLEALGIPFSTTKDEAQFAMEEFGLSFLFAPAFHPILKKLAPLRKNLGVRTVFNAMGPLLNPVRVGRQLMGVYSDSLLHPTAQALKALGSKEVLIVRGEDGADELSLATFTRVVHFKNGSFEEKQIHPSDLGLKAAPLSEIAGGNAEDNARLILSVLEGEKGPHRDVCLLNSAAAFMVSGKALDLKEGLERAQESIDSGAAYELAQRMRRPSLARFA